MAEDSDPSAIPQILIREADAWLRFDEPIGILQTQDLAGVMPLLQSLEQAVQADGLWAVGFISYEAAPAFDRALAARGAGPLPLTWFGLFRGPSGRWQPGRLAGGEPATGGWQPSIGRAAYTSAIHAIKQAIAEGATYQVNFTFRLRRALAGSAWPLFQALAIGQQPPYGAWISTDAFEIASASPELFFALSGQDLIARPMKGTCPRGRTRTEDAAAAAALASSAKERAENAMIVDMIRNDMGRIARYGTVQVRERFACEKYPTLWQMTSTVGCSTGAGFAEILSALFPCASITGAPKSKTTQIIASLEPDPRGVYTGAIGFFAPGRRAQFSVAIRTLAVDRRRSVAEYGVGGGVVWDSTDRDEYAESLLKARILDEPRVDFCLLESLLWTPQQGYPMLARHLARLAGSADYFSIPVDQAAIKATLENAAANLAPVPHKVRLLVDRDGAARIEAEPLPASQADEPVRLQLAPRPVDFRDPFLFHKTTRRAAYENARQACPGADDTLLYNERGEITEATIANLVVALEGELLTPPVSSGLLAGVMRGYLLERGEIRERVIRRADLGAARALYLVNSVRGWRRALLVGAPAADGSRPAIATETAARCLDREDGPVAE